MRFPNPPTTTKKLKEEIVGKRQHKKTRTWPTSSCLVTRIHTHTLSWQRRQQKLIDTPINIVVCVCVCRLVSRLNLNPCLYVVVVVVVVVRGFFSQSSFCFLAPLQLDFFFCFQHITYTEREGGKERPVLSIRTDQRSTLSLSLLTHPISSPAVDTLSRFFAVANKNVARPFLSFSFFSFFSVVFCRRIIRIMGENISTKGE